MIMKAVIGLIGLGVMGENLALNIAEKGFPISVYNRTREKTEKLKEKIYLILLIGEIMML